ncbi:D-xylose ABC transporter substrate-binding protein [Sutcliffiella cohnii]|uniref:D-xylose ABC transporter substrate-binding protein n=1 Tax=Sutcliffiella cohnii TaxID=33932 RepID=A0A223KVH4_9BACI|nr:D-xylose ABC transporter substrate-binding protein [Sutcliffiella cohnii]AST93466.1 D-xylose ABC transporter substrate-binding protein [Sutcliffiella cohnii]
MGSRLKKLIVFILLLFMAACEGENNIVLPVEKEESIALDTEEKIKIGFSMDTLEEERWPKDRELFKEAAEALGAEVLVREAKGDDALQIVQAESLISEGINILVIVPHNAEAVATIVKKAHLAGIKVISYDRLVKNSSVDLYISFDNELVGQLQAEEITKLVPKGKYVYIGGASTDNNAHLLKKGVFKVLQPFIERGDIQVVYDQWTENWDPENARAYMEEALKANQNEIDAVIAANDATAGGIIEALTAHGLAGTIPVAGQDADLSAVQYIVDGKQAMTVYKPIKALTEEAAKIAIMMAKGEKMETDQVMNNEKEEVPSVFLRPIPVDQKNIDETIIADGFHSYADVYKEN